MAQSFQRLFTPAIGIAGEQHGLEPLAYAKGPGNGIGFRGIGDVPIKPPANRNRPRRAPGPKRVVVLDRGMGRYLGHLLGLIGVEAVFAQSGDEFIAQLDAQAPHLALVHISELRTVVRMKALMKIAATPTVVVNSFGRVVDEMMSQAGLLGPIIDIPYAESDVRAAINMFGRSEVQPFPEPVPYLIGDPSLLPAEREPVAGERRILVCAENQFYSVYFSRILQDLGRVIVDARIDSENVFSQHKPDAVLVFDSFGFRLRRVRAAAAKSDTPIVALVPARHRLTSEDIGTGDAASSLHTFPIDRPQLLQIVQDALRHSARKKT